MAPRNPALAGWGPFNPNWRLLGIAFCKKTIRFVNPNPVPSEGESYRKIPT